MLTRRSFFWSSAAALVAGRVSPALAQTRGSLPPSLAALSSMKSQATPITNEERRVRIEKARQLMTRHKIDALMLTQGTSLVYFTNIRWAAANA